MSKLLLVAALCLGLPVAAMAQPAQLKVQEGPVGFAGTVVKYSDTSVTLNDKYGKTFEVQMTPGWTVSRLQNLDSGAIKAGNFVATANTVVDAGTGRSTELRILEAGYRPEFGTHLMAQGGTAMTHGTVAKVAPGAAGVDLEVTYPGGSRHIIVPPDVKVTGFQLLDRSVLKPGTPVSSVTRKGPDGVPRAGRLVVS